MASKKYKVLSPLKHDGKAYEPGSFVNLDESGADWLISFGILKEPEDATKKKEGK